MTKNEQIEEMAKYICDVCDFKCGGIETDGMCTQVQETAEAIYEAGYRRSPDKEIVFITVSEPDKERIIPEGEPIKDGEVKGALGEEGKTSCDAGEYKNRFEIADKVLTETRAKLAKAEHDRDRYKAKLEKIPLAIKQKIMEEDDYELTEREQATLFLDRMGSDIEILHNIVKNLDELLAKGIDEYIMGIDGSGGAREIWEHSAVRAFAEKVKAKSYVNARCTKVVEIEKIDEILKEYE